MSKVLSQITDNILFLALNNGKVNALSHELRQALYTQIENAQTESIDAIVITGNDRIFSAGADITEFGKPPQSPSLVELTKTIENSNKPVIAAINGAALGGGLELALACHLRYAKPSAKLGLPEVNLGLIPGAGGTQRTPRLIGFEPAIKFITSGKAITGIEALGLGLINGLVDENLKQQIIELCKSVLSKEIAPISSMPCPNETDNEALFDHYRAKVARTARGQHAPLKIIDAIEKSTLSTFEEGMAFERSAFLELLKSEQSTAMRHVFFGQKAANKIDNIATNVKTRDISTVAVIGAGTMGGGIAMNFANAGIPVVILDLSEDSLAKGLSTIKKNYQISASKKRITEKQMKERLTLVSGTTHYEDLADADLVIEAVFEDLNIKQTVFKKLDTICKSEAILATNTSYQDVNQIAAATSRPSDVVGLHFFSPANVMQLLEVVRGSETADDVLLTSMQLANTINKIPVLAGVCYGFIGNRILSAYLRQSQLCLLEGATPAQIDKAMENWGAAMGPMAMGDLAGLDIGYKARQGLSDDNKEDPKTYSIADAMYHANRLGQKTGAGYYEYNSSTREKKASEEARKIIESQSREHGINRIEFSEKDIRERLLFALINEAAQVLNDGIAQRASDIDVVYIYGYGFPKFRGGPLHYADSLGLDYVHDRIKTFYKASGSRYWKPSALLETLAKDGLSFSEWDASRSAIKS